MKRALLLGCDFYFAGAARDQPNRKLCFSHLSGCVNDVNDINDFLVRLGVENITKLTATPNRDRDWPVERENLWPTRKNIERELNRIKKDATRGDLLYIHYSGHGIRRDNLPSKLHGDKGDTVSGTALVMIDVLLGEPYLTGYQLGVWIRELVETYGLRVTLVLDSCFSGGGVRTGEDGKRAFMRTLPDEYDDSQLQCDIDADSAANDMNPDFPTRDPSWVRKSWLSDPKGCTVVSACGYDQGALEVYFGSKCNGLLTHSMLKLLNESVNANAIPAAVIKLPSHSHVVSSVTRALIDSNKKQTPILNGDGNYEFFGPSSYVLREICRVLSWKGSEIELDVGVVQGVAEGAIYDLFPQRDALLGLPYYTQARVTKAFMFNSKAVLLDVRKKPGDNLYAVLRKWALPRPVYVKFVPGLDNNTCSEFKRSLEGTFNLFLTSRGQVLDVEEDFIFTVRENGQHYEIFQKGKRLSRVPQIHIGESMGLDKLAKIFNHLARFQALRRLKDLPRSLWSKFTFEATPVDLLNGRDEQGIVRVRHGQKLKLSASYDAGDQERGKVWLSTYCFTASWGIIKIDPAAESGQVAHSAYAQISPTMNMYNPPRTCDDDPADVEDVFVMFASTGVFPVSWGDICLPSLTVDELLPDLQTKDRYRDPGRINREFTRDPDWNLWERVVQVTAV